MLFSFSLCELGFLHKIFDETTCAMQLANVMYSFLQELFFPTGFSDGVFDEACTYRGNRPRGSVVKHKDFPRRKGGG